MAFDSSLRVLKERVLVHFAKLFKNIVSPTQLTVFGFFLGLVSCYFCFLGDVYLATSFWVLNRIFDGEVPDL